MPFFYCVIENVKEEKQKTGHILTILFWNFKSVITITITTTTIITDFCGA